MKEILTFFNIINNNIYIIEYDSHFTMIQRLLLSCTSNIKTIIFTSLILMSPCALFTSIGQGIALPSSNEGEVSMKRIVDM